MIERPPDSRNGDRGTSDRCPLALFRFARGELHHLRPILGLLRNHASATAVVLEVVIRGRHLGPWRGLPATGAQIELPLCGIYTFDEDDRLAGERIYYDRATLLRQLGVFHEPDGAIGRMTTLLTHPLTMAQVVVRKFWRRN